MRRNYWNWDSQQWKSDDIKQIWPRLSRLSMVLTMWALTLGSGEWTQLWGPPGAVLTHWIRSCKLQDWRQNKISSQLEWWRHGTPFQVRSRTWRTCTCSRRRTELTERTWWEPPFTVKCGDGVPASGVHHIWRTILPKRSYLDHWRELHKNKNKSQRHLRSGNLSISTRFRILGSIFTILETYPTLANMAQGLDFLTIERKIY